MNKYDDKGEKMFKVKFDGIPLYQDKDLEEETFSVMVEKDTIIPGTYITDKIVLFGEPYNVYCSSINVEPVDIQHSEWKDKSNQHQYDSTVVINVDDIDKVDNELEVILFICILAH